MPKSKLIASRSKTGTNIVFNENVPFQRWMCYDPGSNKVIKANRAARGYNDNHDELLLASVVSAFDYLVNDCPSTKQACKQLAELRAAVRMLPEPEVE